MMRGTDRCLSVNEKRKRWGMLMKKKDYMSWSPLFIKYD